MLEMVVSICSILLDMASVEGKFDAFVIAYKCVFVLSVRSLQIIMISVI